MPIDLRVLNQADEAWFYSEFVQGFMDAYADKTFFMLESGKVPKLVGPGQLEEKRAWLLQSAKGLGRDYIFNKKENYKAFKITYQEDSAGAILYQLDPNLANGCIYLELLFVCVSFQKKGIATHIIEQLLPQLHPTYRRYELLTRHQNDIALRSYTKLGFQVGDISLVQKYGHSPLYYIGFYKER